MLKYVFNVLKNEHVFKTLKLLQKTFSMLEMMKKLLQSELGPLKHEVDRLNSRVNNMDIILPPQEEVAVGATGETLAVQLAKTEDTPEGIKSNRPVRSCTQFHPYKKTG